jgi:hypothetical protein
VPTLRICVQQEGIADRGAQQPLPRGEKRTVTTRTKLDGGELGVTLSRGSQTGMRILRRARGGTGMRGLNSSASGRKPQLLLITLSLTIISSWPVAP